MLYLFIASVLWAPSFGLIKYNLAGLDSNFIAWARLLVSFLVFVPFLRPGAVAGKLAGKLVALGAIQYGLMYMSYTCSFQFLSAHQVALFTIFTPLYVTLIHDLLDRKFHRVFLLTALLAVAGTAIIVYSEIGEVLQTTLIGFLIVQISNICFAIGQVYYRKLMGPNRGVRDRDVFAWLYLGAVLSTVLPACLTTGGFRLCLSGDQILTLLYLGIVPSGIGFFLWNVGAVRTNAGTLAVFNNAKIPLAIMCALVVFGEHVQSPWRLATGAAVILAAVTMNEKHGKIRSHSPPPGSDTECVD